MSKWNGNKEEIGLKPMYLYTYILHLFCVWNVGLSWSRSDIRHTCFLRSSNCADAVEGFSHFRRLKISVNGELRILHIVIYVYTIIT